MLNVLSDVLQALRLADVFDIILSAVLLYAFFAWLRGMSRSAAMRILVLLALFALVYLLVLSFDLYLVERALQILFIVFVVATVVVFQTEIRRMLDQIATWSYTRRTTSGSDGDTAVAVVVESVEHMASERTGALIAIKGREPIEGHLRGGIALDGYVSQPLLYSIFDPRTAGHDGVVVLDGDRVTRFAAHLPLSETTPDVSRYGGTRHIAALGLAEQCDALVIVVSEESGRISIAEEGRIEEVASADELTTRLQGFWKAHYGGGGKDREAFWSRHRWQMATLSLVLAGLLWALFAYSPVSIQRTLLVPVEFRDLPEGWQLDNDHVTAISIDLSGPEQAFRRLDPDNLTVSFDASDPVEGRNVFIVGEDDLALPSQIDLTNADPRELEVTARRLRTVSLPVEVRTEGSLPDPFELEGLRVDPDSVTVLVSTEWRGDGPLLTEPVDLRQIETSETIETRLVLPQGVRLPSGRSNQVTVQVTVQPSN